MTQENAVAKAKKAVLLVNLGSPEAPTVSAVRRFLRAFLGDPRVVNIPRPIWWLILNFFILPFRPRKALHAYQKIWDPKGSPLSFLTKQLTGEVAKLFDSQEVRVEYAMSYSTPLIETRLKEFQQDNINDILILPLYPQFSSTTSASVHDCVVSEFKRRKYIPNFRFISDYACHEDYIAALAESISAARQNYTTDLLLFSFHGLPKQLTTWGDPYEYQCHATAELVAAKLGLEKSQWKLVFQSRFGKAEWLKPYCVDTLMELPKQGVKHIDVVCPGFAVDCLETLEEIAIANQEVFLEAGGESYHYIPALNDSPRHAQVLANLIKSWLG